MAEPMFSRVPGLLGPIFEEGGTGDRQMREALFLTFNVDLGFFESRLLGQVRSAGAAVTVVADGSVFAPDPRNVRSAGHSYALGLAAMNGAFHPKLTILAGPQRALIGIGSGNLTIGGWHANEEVLTTIRASREEGVPAVVRDLVTFLRTTVDRVTMSRLALDGVKRTANELSTLADTATTIETGHRLVHSLTGSILAQLPDEQVDELEIAAPFHDPGARALDALISRHAPRRVTILAQPGQAVMDVAALESVSAAAGVNLRFVQLNVEDASQAQYRHGKVITAIRDDTAVWSLVGSPNATAAALLGSVPIGNCELAILSTTNGSLLPKPTIPVPDPVELTYTLAGALDPDIPTAPSDSSRLLEARAVTTGVEVRLSAPTPTDVTVEISRYADSPDAFQLLGIVRAGEEVALFPGEFTVGSRVRIGGQLQFLAFPEYVVSRMHPTGAGRPNHDSTVNELFASDVAAAQWHDALTRLLLNQGGSPGRAHAPQKSDQDAAASEWRTLEDPDRWSEYTDDALTRLGMPIFQLAAGGASAGRPVGGSLPNVAPAWEDHFEEITESFEDEAADSTETVGEAETSRPVDLSPHERSRLRRWVAKLVELTPRLGPLETIAVTQLTIAGSSALIWDSDSGAAGWFDPLAAAVFALARDDWPSAASERAGAVAAIGLYRLRMAMPADERGRESDRVRDLAKMLRSLVSGTSPAEVSANLELLTGTTLVARTADEVMADVREMFDATPERTVVRLLEHLMPDLNIAWSGHHQLVLEGHTTNPKGTAAQALSQARSIPMLAVRVDATNGTWIIAAKVADRVTLVEGGERPITYKTFDTTGLLNPIGVLTDQDIARTRRISTPPFTRPDGRDLDVLNAFTGLLESGSPRT